jgi:hypothetical protein
LVDQDELGDSALVRELDVPDLVAGLLDRSTTFWNRCRGLSGSVTSRPKRSVSLAKQLTVIV